jgi:hypothetical protein
MQEEPMRKAFIVFEESWTGRQSAHIVWDEVNAPMESKLSRQIGPAIELTGQLLELANGTRENRISLIVAGLSRNAA